ncbi:MAG: hypothetical protein R3E32_11210 [Chitinophagales bacterium]
MDPPIKNVTRNQQDEVVPLPFTDEHKEHQLDKQKNDEGDTCKDHINNVDG